MLSSMISAKPLLKISGIWQKLLQHLKGMTERKIFFAPLPQLPLDTPSYPQLPPSYGLKAKLERLLWSILLELNHTGSLPFLTVKEL